MGHRTGLKIPSCGPRAYIEGPIYGFSARDFDEALVLTNQSKLRHSIDEDFRKIFTRRSIDLQIQDKILVLCHVRIADSQSHQQARSRGNFSGKHTSSH